MFMGHAAQQRVQKDYTAWGDTMMAFYRTENPDQQRFFDMTYYPDLATADADATKTQAMWAYVNGETYPIRVWETTINSGAGGWVFEGSGWGIDSNGDNPGQGWENTLRRLFAREYPHTKLPDTYGPFSSDYKTANAEFVKFWSPLTSFCFYPWPYSTFQKTGTPAYWAYGSGHYFNGEYDGTNMPNDTGSYTNNHIMSNQSSNNKGWMYVTSSDGFTGVTSVSTKRFEPSFSSGTSWRFTIPHFPVSSMTGLTSFGTGSDRNFYQGWDTAGNDSRDRVCWTVTADRLPDPARVASGACKFWSFDSKFVCISPPDGSPIQITQNIAGMNAGQIWGYYSDTAIIGHPGSYIRVEGAGQAGYVLDWFAGGRYHNIAISIDVSGTVTNTKYHQGMNRGSMLSPTHTDRYGNTLNRTTWDTTQVPVFDISTQDQTRYPGSSDDEIFENPDLDGMPTIKWHSVTKAVSGANACTYGGWSNHYWSGTIMWDFSAGVNVGVNTYVNGLVNGQATIGAFDCSNVTNCIKFGKAEYGHNPLLYNVGAHSAFKAFIFIPLSSNVSTYTAAQLDYLMTNALADRSAMSAATLYIWGHPGTSTCDTSIATAKNWNVDTTTSFIQPPTATV